MEDFDVIPMFSSPLFSIQVKEDTDELNESNSYFVGSSRQGTGNVTNDSFNILDRHPRVKNILLSYWKRINSEYLFNECEHIITTSWITKTKKLEYSQVHWHKNSYFSAVYYYGEYDDGCGDIIMLNPLEKFTDFYTPSPGQNNIFNSNVWGAKPKKNKLIFFPSYISHQVSGHNSDLPRYSLAFNISPVGTYGAGDSYIDTNWYGGKPNINEKVIEEKIESNTGWSFDMLSGNKNTNNVYPGDHQ